MKDFGKKNNFTNYKYKTYKVERLLVKTMDNRTFMHTQTLNL